MPNLANSRHPTAKVSKSDEDEEGWRQVGEPLRFKRFVPWKNGGGVVLVDKEGSEVVLPDGVASFGSSPE